MRLATHAAFGAFLTLGVASVTGLPVTPASLGLAVLASTLPELDHERSEIGSLLKPISKRLARRYGHRTFTHSFVGLGLFGLLVSPLVWLGFEELWWALLLGYLSHILLDVWTPKGVCWFWPSLTPVGFGEARIKSGSAGESAVLAASLGLSLLIYPLVDVGVLGALRSAIGDIDSTFEEYRRLAGSGVEVDLAGELQENATKRIVRGRWPIVDLTEDGKGYWVLMEGVLRSVGRGPGRDFYPLKVHVRSPTQAQTQTQAQDRPAPTPTAAGAGAGAGVGVGVGGRGGASSAASIPIPIPIPISIAHREWIPLVFEVSSASALLVEEGKWIEEGQLLGYKEPDPKAETVEELLRSREVRSPVSGVVRRLTVQAREKGLRVEALVEGFTYAASGEASAGSPPDPDPDPDPSPLEIYFSPGPEPERALIRLMRSAQRSLHLALYYFTDDELAQALVEACLRLRVRVRGQGQGQGQGECRVLLDEEQRTARYSQAGFLLARGVEVRFFEDEGIFHHKFLVVDGECVATGSYNWTESAQRRNEENVVVICDPQVAGRYEEEFVRLWEDPRSRP